MPGDDKKGYRGEGAGEAEVSEVRSERGGGERVKLVAFLKEWWPGILYAAGGAMLAYSWLMANGR